MMPVNDIPNIPRMLDQLPVISARDHRHEEAPQMPSPQKSGGELIADKSIGIVDEAAALVLGKFQELKDQIQEAEQMVLNSQIEVRETIRTHMRIVEMAMKCQQQINAQIAEAVAPLVARNWQMSDDRPAAIHDRRRHHAGGHAVVRTGRNEARAAAADRQGRGAVQRPLGNAAAAGHADRAQAGADHSDRGGAAVTIHPELPGTGGCRPVAAASVRGTAGATKKTRQEARGASREGHLHTSWPAQGRDQQWQKLAM